ncbi:hypothetical protein [Paenibacillus larvae]|uniref:hypothetical protein n=1 Tax=Paenibacillus larvae TaxID=1464 RepID=UPI0001694C21|nr:hypothetical protein [Paenibacillus larvae]
MLQVDRITSISEENIEIDEYIPINVKWIANQQAFDGTLYWRTGDFKKSLFELAISKRNGCILSLTLTLVDKTHIDIIGYSEIIAPIIKGLPLFKTKGMFQNGFFDEVNEFTIAVNNNAIRIIFHPKFPIVKQIKSGRIKFGLSEQNLLTMIEITELSKEEHKELLRSLMI